MVRAQRLDEKQEVSLFMRYVFFYASFFFLLLLIASFGLIAES
jgi:hypothetical protein